MESFHYDQHNGEIWKEFHEGIALSAVLWELLYIVVQFLLFRKFDQDIGNSDWILLLLLCQYLCLFYCDHIVRHSVRSLYGIKIVVYEIKRTVMFYIKFQAKHLAAPSLCRSLSLSFAFERICKYNCIVESNTRSCFSRDG
jgi:hypothetical protein